MPVLENELRWIVIITEVLREFRATHSDLEVLADFKMQMRIVKPVGVSERRDLLAAPHRLTAMHHNRQQMSVERIDAARHAAIAICVTNDDYISPALVTITCEHDHAVANAVDRIAQIGVAAANSIPIFAEMS